MRSTQFFRLWRVQLGAGPQGGSLRPFVGWCGFVPEAVAVVERSIRARPGAARMMRKSPLGLVGRQVVALGW